MYAMWILVTLGAFSPRNSTTQQISLRVTYTRRGASVVGGREAKYSSARWMAAGIGGGVGR